jgi:hypothetical protein
MQPTSENENAGSETRNPNYTNTPTHLYIRVNLSTLFAKTLKESYDQKYGYNNWNRIGRSSTQPVSLTDHPGLSKARDERRSISSAYGPSLGTPDEISHG